MIVEHLRRIHPLPLGDGRVRVSRFEKTCDPHPALRAALSQRERDLPYPGSRNARNSAVTPLPPIATTMYCFPFNM